MTLEEGHASYEQLQEPAIPTYKSFYFLNLTNPVAFQGGNATAVLREIGPYTYRYKLYCCMVNTHGVGSRGGSVNRIVFECVC